jgi:thiol-disulfide isomerase/thioredoxin
MSIVDELATNDFWTEVTTTTGETLAELAEQRPVLLVFLRHFGCSFCREAIADLSKLKQKLDADGITLVMVHMAADEKTAVSFFRKYKLWPVLHILDPQKRHYLSFGLGRGTPQQLFGLMNWIRGFQAGVVEGHGFAYHGEEMGDGFQMPGVFTLHKGKIISSFIHQNAWDRPDYNDLIDACGQ